MNDVELIDIKKQNNMKELISKIEAFLTNNNVQKVSNALIATALWIFNFKIIAGVFFGFFIVANKDLFASLWTKVKAMLVSEEKVVEQKVSDAVKTEETKVVDAVKSEEQKVVDAVKSKI